MQNLIVLGAASWCGLSKSKALGGSAVLAIALGLGGCGAMPASAPTSSEVVGSSATAEANGDFVVIDVDRKVANALSRTYQQGFAGKFQSKAPPADLRIAVGDTLQIGVLESAPGLFSQSGAGVARPQEVRLLPLLRPQICCLSPWVGTA